MCVAIALPSVSNSLYFHNKENDSPKNTNNLEMYEKSKENIFFKARKLLWKHFIESYSNRKVLLWSLWWGLATCGYTQVIMPPTY